MTTRHRPIQPAGRFSRRSQHDPRSYDSIVDRLLSEMVSMLRASETRGFDAPFKLLIVSSQGTVVFSGEIGREIERSLRTPLRITGLTRLKAGRLGRLRR